MQLFLRPCILALLCLAIKADPAPGDISTAILPNGKASVAGIKKHDMMRREDTAAPGDSTPQSPPSQKNSISKVPSSPSTSSQKPSPADVKEPNSQAPPAQKDSIPKAQIPTSPSSQKISPGDSQKTSPGDSKGSIPTKDDVPPGSSPSQKDSSPPVTSPQKASPDDWKLPESPKDDLVPPQSPESSEPSTAPQKALPADSKGHDSVKDEADHVSDEPAHQATHPAGDAELDKAFSRYDADGSGALEKDECEKLMADMGLKNDAWKVLDADHNGVISRSGFERLISDEQVFHASDVDSSGFLEAPEIEAVVKRAGLTAHSFNWTDYDRDKDGKLSVVEFLEAGPAAATAAALQAQSLLEEDDENITHDSFVADEDADAVLQEPEDDDSDNEALSLLDEGEVDEGDSDTFSFLDEGEEALNEEASSDDDGSDDTSFGDDALTTMTGADPGNNIVWKMFNKNGDNVLDKDEIANLVQEAQFEKGFDVQDYDEDHDGNLDKKEFT